MSSVSLPRTIFDPDHDAFRRTARAFAENEVAPHLDRWSAQGRVDRALYRKAGELGLLHGGYGYMSEYDVARDYLDCRGSVRYAGTTEIMKEIIGRKLTKR